MIGSLLYLTASCLDIAFSVSVCARFQSNPKGSHLNAVKRIINMLVVLVILDCFIAKSQMYLLLVILRQIRLVMLMIKKASLEGVFMCEPMLLLG